MHRKHNHRESATRAARPSLQSLSVCVWNFTPGVFTSLNTPPAERRANSNELLGNSRGQSFNRVDPILRLLVGGLPFTLAIDGGVMNDSKWRLTA